MKEIPFYHLPQSNLNPSTRQTGFTLVELMISLVLGLLISAAVMQIYITNVKTSTIQKSGSELQDASVFGLQLLESHIRLANLGNPTLQINNTTPLGGIVLAGENIGTGISNYADTGYLSRGEGEASSGTNGWTGVSNTNVPSDQLTIQFTNKTKSNMPDCEGTTLANDEVAIERYFLRLDTNETKTAGVRHLVLACDAGRVSGANVSNFGDAGQPFIDNIDQFKVLLGVQDTSGGTVGNLQYLSIQDYNDNTRTPEPKPAIVAVKFGVIAHGNTPIIANEDATSFTLLGTANTLNTDADRTKQVRTTYESTSMLRNARVVSTVASDVGTAF